MSKEIAKIINRQINSGSDASGKNSGLRVVGCWGVEQRVIIEREAGKHSGGLKLIVNGRFHTGIVNIYLVGDLYTIEFVKNGKVVYTTEDIYCESLTMIIDSYIESNQMRHHGEAA